MKLFVLDIECFYDDEYTLSKTATAEYVRDPRWETIGIGVVNPATGQRKFFEHEQFKKAAAQEDWSKIAVLCHHAHFDCFALNYHYGVRPAYIFDTLSMANALHPGQPKHLADLAQRYGVGVKGHEVIEAKGKHRADLTFEEYRRYGEYCLNDCDLTYGVFKAMLPKFPRLELDLIDITVRMFSEPCLVLDEPRMREYLEWETARKQELMDRVLALNGEADYAKTKAELKDLEKLKKKIIGGPRFADVLRDRGIEPQTKPTTSKQGWAYAFAKTDSFMQALLEHEDDEIRWLAEARVSAKSTGALTRTERMLRLGANGAAIPIYLKYAGAHTLRWSGSDGSNPQNWQRVNKKKPNTGMIRKSIKAPKGYKIVVADASQIEARTTAHLAGENWLLDAFSQHRDVYSEFATEAFGRHIDRKKNPDDELPGFVGKVCVLGLGYSMGWFKLAETFLAGAIGGPPVQFTAKDYEALQIDGARFLNNPKKVEMVESMLSRLPMKDRLIHCIVSEEFVRRYRNKNQNIVKLWKHMEQVLAWMNEGVECHAGLPVPVYVSRHRLTLEGGLSIHYPGLEYDGKQYTYLGGKSGKERVKAYGGSVTENVVQWLARCVTAGHMAQYAKRFKVALMTHDEVVSVVPDAHVSEALAWKLQLMKTPPAWAPGLPLDAEGAAGEVYGEIK